MSGRAVIIFFIPAFLALMSALFSSRVFRLGVLPSLTLVVWFSFIIGLLQTPWLEEFVKEFSSGSNSDSIQSTSTENIVLATRIIVLPLIVGSLFIDLMQMLVLRSVSENLAPVLQAARPIFLASFVVVGCSSVGKFAETFVRELIRGSS